MPLWPQVRLGPAGRRVVLFKKREVFNEELIFYVNYLGGEMTTATLNFSRGTAPWRDCDPAAIAQPFTNPLPSANDSRVQGSHARAHRS